MRRLMRYELRSSGTAHPASYNAKAQSTMPEISSGHPSPTTKTEKEEMTQPATVSIKLNVEEVNLVLEHLMAGTYRRTAPLIDSITRQAENQLELQKAAEAIAADDAQASFIPPEGDPILASVDA